MEMTGLKNIRKRLLGVVIILSWFLLIWKSYGNDLEWYVENRCLLGLLYAMVYAPWLYGCFNERKGLNLFPELPKDWQNTLGKFNVMANALPALIGLLYFILPSDRFVKEMHVGWSIEANDIVSFPSGEYMLAGWASEADDIVIFWGLAYWYVSYSIYFIMKGNYPSKKFNWSYVGWLMLAMFVIFMCE